MALGELAAAVVTPHGQRVNDPFIVRDRLTNLSEALPDVAQTVTSEYFDASVSTVTDESGDVFGVPLFTDFGLLLYRRDLVSEAGFDPAGWATEPLSWPRFASTVNETAIAHGITEPSPSERTVREADTD